MTNKEILLKYVSVVRYGSYMIEPTIFTNIILGIVQGLTEFLPISSSGHLILAREFLGSAGVLDLTFDSFLHFATAAAIVVYFWRDILKLTATLYTVVTGLLPNGSNRITPFGIEVAEEDKQMLYALIVGIIPAVILGLFLEDIMATIFRNPLLVAVALIIGSLIMISAERYTTVRNSNGQGGSLTIWEKGSWKKGLAIGLFQSLALIPGMSRSGMTISGGMFFGLPRAVSAKFSFLLGIPIFIGAGAKQAFGEIGVDVLIGTFTAFIVAIFVIHYLLKFLRNNTLYIFVWYRLLLALGIIIVFI